MTYADGCPFIHLFDSDTRERERERRRETDRQTDGAEQGLELFVVTGMPGTDKEVDIDRLTDGFDAAPFGGIVVGLHCNLTA